MHQIENPRNLGNLGNFDRDRQTDRQRGGVLEVERNPKNRMNKEERRGEEE
jgi:hypothetical protein